MPIQIPFLPLNVPPYLLSLDPTLYFDRYHLSKYILQLAKIKKLGKALDKIEQNDIINKSPVEGLICECAGIGRQASLRCLCSTGRVGSSPITRTTFLFRLWEKNFGYARVVELADSLDSGSSAHYGRAGSSPASRTTSFPPKTSSTRASGGIGRLARCRF